jgi:hypothetical protein
MKRYALLPAFFLISFTLGAQPVDITLGGGIDSLSINTANLDGKYDLESTEFAIIPFWFARAEGEIGKKFRFDLQYRQDPLWQSTLSGSVGTIYKLLDIGLGTQFGFHDFSSGDFSFENVETWNTGIITWFKVEDPGVFFVGFDYLLNLPSGYTGDGKSERHYLAAKGGFWLPHILVKGFYSRKEYAESKKEGLTISAGQEKFGADMEFFSKSSPFRLSVGAGSLKLSTDVEDSGGGSGNNDVTYMYISACLTLILDDILQFYVRGEVPLKESEMKLHKAAAEAGVIVTNLDSRR